MCTSRLVLTRQPAVTASPAPARASARRGDRAADQHAGDGEHEPAPSDGHGHRAPGGGQVERRDLGCGGEQRHGRQRELGADQAAHHSRRRRRARSPAAARRPRSAGSTATADAAHPQRGEVAGPEPPGGHRDHQQHQQRDQQAGDRRPAPRAGGSRPPSTRRTCAGRRLSVCVSATLDVRSPSAPRSPGPAAPGPRPRTRASIWRVRVQPGCRAATTSRLTSAVSGTGAGHPWHPGHRAGRPACRRTSAAARKSLPWPRPAADRRRSRARASGTRPGARSPC